MCRSKYLVGTWLVRSAIGAVAVTGCAVGVDPDAQTLFDARGNDVVTPTDDVPVTGDDVRTDAGQHADAAQDRVVFDFDVPAGDDVPVAVDVPMGVDVPCSPLLVVNEVQTGSAASASDEFVEIHNKASCAVSLAGWTIRYAAVMGTALLVKWTGAAADSIPANGYVVIGGPAYTGTTIGSLGTTGAFAAAGGGVGIYDASGTRVDSVGYGSAATNPLIEGTPAAAPANGQSAQRIPNGTDTDNNASDFTASTPTPGAANH